MTELPDSLRVNVSDRTVVLGTAVSGMLDLLGPCAGSLFAALITSVIPNQRLDRLADYLVALRDKLRVVQEGMSFLTDRQENLEQAMRLIAQGLSVDQTALFEDGAAAAVRATSKARIERISVVVANGLNESQEAARDRQILDLLQQVEDIDLILLCSYDARFSMNADWCSTHRSSLLPVGNANMRRLNKVEQEISTLHEYRITKLENLGLINSTHEFDIQQRNTGNISLASNIKDHVRIIDKKSRPHITTLGRLLIKTIGIDPPDAKLASKT